MKISFWKQNAHSLQLKRYDDHKSILQENTLREWINTYWKKQTHPLRSAVFNRSKLKMTTKYAKWTGSCAVVPDS